MSIPIPPADSAEPAAAGPPLAERACTYVPARFTRAAMCAKTLAVFGELLWRTPANTRQKPGASPVEHPRLTGGERPPITCYIRTLNEESRIGAAVEAAFLVVREVVVVDSGSTDGTVAVAETAGARTVEQPWLGGGHQKRVGEDACRHNWLLDLDADEVLSVELAGEILKLFASGEPGADVFRLPLVTVDPSGRIWRRARTPRRAKLYDRRKVRMPAHGAWDQLSIPAGLRVKLLEGPLLHYAFDDIGHLSRKQGSAMVRRVRFLDDGRRRPATALRVWFGLPVFFLRNYLLRGQWREGRYGFLFALTTAYNHWLRYALLYERGQAPDRDKKGGS